MYLYTCEGKYINMTKDKTSENNLKKETKVNRKIFKQAAPNNLIKVNKREK